MPLLFSPRENVWHRYYSLLALCLVPGYLPYSFKTLLLTGIVFSLCCLPLKAVSIKTKGMHMSHSYIPEEFSIPERMQTNGDCLNSPDCYLRKMLN